MILLISCDHVPSKLTHWCNKCGPKIMNVLFRLKWKLMCRSEIVFYQFIKHPEKGIFGGLGKLKKL